MKRSILAGLLIILSSLFVPLRPASATALDVPVGTGPYVAPPTPTQDVYFHLGALNLTVPWDHINAVYLYDLNAQRNLVGGEAVVASLWRLQGTVGAVTSLEGRGAPYLGGNLWLPNPVPAIALLSQIQPGIFGGWDWSRGAPIWGFKAAISIF